MKQKFAFSRGAEARYKPGFRPYWIQPPAIRHDVRGFSDDFEVLEIVSPGVFETHEA